MKKVVGVVLALFAIFFLVSHPAQAANFVEATFDGISSVFDAMVRFLNALMN